MRGDGVIKQDLGGGGRLARLIRSLVDPRAYAHFAKVLNFHNYSHVVELRRAKLGQDLRISPTATFANGRNIVMGDRVRIGAYSSLMAGPDSAKIELGDDAMLAPNVMITAANYRFDDGGPIARQRMDEADVVIGRDVWIGYGAIVLPGVTIGDGAVVGAAAVVRSDVPPGAVVTGDPARVARRRLSSDQAVETARHISEPGALALEVIRRELPRVAADDLDRPLDRAGLDSFGLIQLRTALEEAHRHQIPEQEWSNVRSLRDAARLPSLVGAPRREAPETASPEPPAAPVAPARPRQPGRARRELELNMPQMALSGLSESWLFKELGDVHWTMITDFLRSPSAAIADETGARLYATFTRIKLLADPVLLAFDENDVLTVDSTLQRYGASFFFADHEVSGGDALCRVRTMSTFAKYGERGANTSLIKGAPVLPAPDEIASLPDFPEFGVEYRQRRAEGQDRSLWECDYEILPSHDINGIGLLYFAAYPSIFDLCIERHEGKGFLIDYSTVEKDVFYFANSDPEETLIFRLHERELDGDRVRHVGSLARKSDGKRMAEIASLKRRMPRKLPK